MSEPQPRPAFSQAYRADPRILDLGDEFYDRVAAADFPRTTLRFRNQRQAATVGLGALDEAQWLGHFGRFEPLPDNLREPLALRYHGHQFRVYNPDIGDGRGFLFAQLRDAQDRLLDLGTKGSGITPWSRSGDGRLTLKGGVREILATEMLEALGVNSSKTFSLIETGEALHRGDEPSPTRSAVLVRLQHSHIRIGTFQRLAFLKQPDAMRRLVDWCLRTLYDEEPGADAPARLLSLVVDRTAKLAASYAAAGFVHGVLNSDNIAITAQSFDYGPWRFTPTWDPDFTAAYFDHQGLYAFGRQAQAIHWDVVQLAVSLRLIGDVDPLTAALEPFSRLYNLAARDALFARLGVAPRDETEDMALVAALVTGLGASGALIDRFFFDWRGGVLRRPSANYDGEAFAAFRDAVAPYAGALPSGDYWDDAAPCSMHIEEVEAIWAAIDARDDWGPFNAKIEAVRRMGEALGGSNDA